MQRHLVAGDPSIGEAGSLEAVDNALTIEADGSVDCILARGLRSARKPALR
jgi:hypothetical protein